MKYIINCCYGGFGVKEEILKRFNIDYFWTDDEELRTDKRLIACIKNGEDINCSYSNLRVIEIPDEATDWELSDYDGWESLICVVNGKICHL